MEWCEDFVNLNGVYGPFRDIDQTFSEELLFLLNFFLGLYAFAIFWLERYRVLDAIKYHGLKSSALKIESKLDESIHELNVDLISLHVEDSDFNNLWNAFIIFY